MCMKPYSFILIYLYQYVATHKGLNTQRFNRFINNKPTSLNTVKVTASKEVVQNEESAKTVSDIHTVDDPKVSYNKPFKSTVLPRSKTIRCFNCSGMGHIAAQCKKPKSDRFVGRPTDSNNTSSGFLVALNVEPQHGIGLVDKGYRPY